MGLTGCHVATTVSVDETSPGQGRVSVRVVFDARAVEALGGAASLERQLDTADLSARGWLVSGPRPGPHSGSVEVSASHSFSSDREAESLLAGVAGPRVFRLQLVDHRSFWHVNSTLSGRVDLSCGLGCFGDSGLQAVTGSVLGVNPASLGGTAAAGRDLSFVFTAHLPGSASAHPGRQLVWNPRLGSVTAVSARAESLNVGSVVAMSLLGGLVLIGGPGGWLLWRRRRRRAGPQHRRPWRARWRRRPPVGVEAPEETVTPTP